MERLTKKLKIELPGEYLASVEVNTIVKPEMPIGTVRVPIILEEHRLDGATPLVDDGVFVTPQTPLFEMRKGLYKREVIGATTEGIIRLTRQYLRVIADDKEEVVKANIWGRITAIDESSYTVEYKQFVLPIFVSGGKKHSGELLCLFEKGPLVTPQQITDAVANKIVVLPGPVNHELYVQIMNKGAQAVLAASIDWKDYLQIFQENEPNIGIFHGFGMFPMWRWYFHLLGKLNGIHAEIDLATSRMYLPVHDILLSNLEHDLLLFKEFWWGKQVKDLQHESTGLIAHLETQEHTPVTNEELFNIR